MTTRKEFILGVAGCVTAEACAIELCKQEDANEKLRTYYGYIAERYVEKIGVYGPYEDKDNKTWFSAAPVGYIEIPNGSDFIRKCVVLPLKDRRVYADTYNVFTRNELICKVRDFLVKTDPAKVKCV